MTAFDSCADRAHGRLIRDVVKRKGERDAARARVAQQSVLLAELRVEVIQIRLAGRLLRFEDFDRFIGVENVIDASGRIDERELEVRLADLLHRRPELGAPPCDDPGILYRRE